MYEMDNGILPVVFYLVIVVPFVSIKYILRLLFCVDDYIIYLHTEKYVCRMNYTKLGVKTHFLFIKVRICLSLFYLYLSLSPHCSLSALLIILDIPLYM